MQRKCSGDVNELQTVQDDQQKAGQRCVLISSSSGRSTVEQLVDSTHISVSCWTATSCGRSKYDSSKGGSQEKQWNRVCEDVRRLFGSQDFHPGAELTCMFWTQTDSPGSVGCRTSPRLFRNTSSGSSSSAILPCCHLPRPLRFYCWAERVPLKCQLARILRDWSCILSESLTEYSCRDIFFAAFSWRRGVPPACFAVILQWARRSTLLRRFGRTG